MSLNINSKLKISFALFALTAIVYTACKKVDSKPVTKTDNSKIVEQIAINVYNSLSASNSGPGIQSSTRLRVNNTAGIFCGYKKDTVYIRDDNQGDTIKSHTSETVKYKVTCDNDMAGYTSYDSLANNMTTLEFNLTRSNVLDFVVKSLNDQYTKFTINGAMRIVSIIKPIKTTGANTLKYDMLKGSYTYKDVVFTYKKPEIDFTGATVTFEGTHVYDGGGAFYNSDSYSGSITFLAGHKATLIYNGTTYTVDLVTGKVI